MRHMLHAATKIEYKTDGKNVWRFSKVKQEWIPDERMTVSVFENIIATGNGYENSTHRALPAYRGNHVPETSK